jgi:hypothetical protein
MLMTQTTSIIFVNVQVQATLKTILLAQTNTIACSVNDGERTERQWPLSGVHSIMMEKLALNVLCAVNQLMPIAFSYICYTEV